MTRKQLIQKKKKKKSYLCVGLDTDLDKIPKHLLKYKQPIVEFNKQIIEATQDLCVAYKPNIAFYEQYGAKGFESIAVTNIAFGEISGLATLLNGRSLNDVQSPELISCSFITSLFNEGISDSE